MNSIEKHICIGALLLIAGPGLMVALDQVSWAASDHAVLCQTIPTRRPTPPSLPSPTSAPQNGEEGDTNDANPASLPSSGERQVTGTPVPTGPPVPTDTPTPVPDATSVNFPNCRFGVAAVRNPLGFYDTSELNLGWYVNFSTSDLAAPQGDIEFVRTVRVHQDKYDWCYDCYTVPYTYTMAPDADTLLAQVETSPGATWIIGNEPDRRDWETGKQDEMVPELYAQAYHEISQLIRNADPTAKIALAGMMQATPLRIEYLDRIWAHYQSLYGQRLGDDVDIWNVHGYILREEQDEWGAEIPAGIADSQGVLYEIDDHANLDYFKEQISRFRMWMRDKGERDKPLYVGEYGVIIPPYYISIDRAEAFMSGSFDFMLDVTDVELGYPADGNRLVQRFLWFSLDDSSDNSARDQDYGGALFSSETLQRLELGDQMAAYVRNPLHVEANTPRINLVVADLKTEAMPADPATLVLHATIQNRGNTRTNSGDGIRVRFWDGKPGNPQAELVGTQIIKDIYGCANEVTVQQPVSIDPEVAVKHMWYADVETLPEEENTKDNIAKTSIAEEGQSP